MTREGTLNMLAWCILDSQEKTKLSFLRNIHKRFRFIKKVWNLYSVIGSKRNPRNVNVMCLSVSIMLQSSAKGFLRVPKGYLSIHKSFQGRKLQGSFKSASREIKESFERASKKLQKSFKIGSRELYENPKRSLKELLREL